MRLFAILLGLVLAASLFGQPEPKMAKKKKNEDKEPVTQSLPLLPVPPLVISAETGRLTFQLSPLSSKGLLSQQSRDALKALMQSNRGASLVRVRAFVAGTGDMRRVQQIISETFSEKKLPLPVLTTVQVGALPLVGAQVELEAVSEDKKIVDPDGVVFFPAAPAKDIKTAVSQLRGAIERSGVSAPGILSVTCFADSIDDAEAARPELAAAFPGAVLDLVEAQRTPVNRSSMCEAAGRVEPGNSPVPGPQAVVVKTPKIVFSGIQMAFGREESDLRLAFERMDKALSSQSGAGGVIAVQFYAMDASLNQKLGALGREVFHKDSLAAPVVEVEGLPSLDASIGMEVIAATER